MSASNRNSTPDQSASLRPPTSRPLAGHHLRASADLSSFQPSVNNRIRPASEIFLNAPQIAQQNQETEALDKAAQQWLMELETYEQTLSDMATASLDQEFKDELSAIEEWFRVLSEAERTAALYALLQQTTQVQIRFFISILTQMSKSSSNPMAAMLSPANFEKDAMSKRMSDAMSSLDINRNSFSRPPPSPTANRSGNAQGLDPQTVQAMFPDAAAAIDAHRKQLTQGSNGTKSNRNSAVFDRNINNLTLATPTITTSKDNTLPPSSPWRTSQDDTTTQPPNAAANKPANQVVGQMGQWQAPPPSAGLRSPRPPLGGGNIQNTTLTAPSNSLGDLPPLSPYESQGNWASMVNTPVVPVFGTGNANADMVANATAMKLAALSTVNNRIILDKDMPKYKRRTTKLGENGLPGGLPSPRPGQSMQSPTNIVMYNEHGQPIPINAAAAVAAAQNNLRNSRPNSPGLAFQSPTAFGLGGFASPQANGFLAAASPLLNGGFNLQYGSLSGGSEGYHSDRNSRGHSPRGRRGSSKAPENIADTSLLHDIPQWLRSLRLHKYTDNLKDLKWEELVDLDDEALEKRGVSALGARRKMLKVFESIKEAKATGKIDGSA